MGRKMSVTRYKLNKSRKHHPHLQETPYVLLHLDKGVPERIFYAIMASVALLTMLQALDR